MDAAAYDFDLPRDRIAQEPAPRRDASRLLRLSRKDGRIEHGVFRDLPARLGPGDVLVLNDTRVIPARVAARRASGGRVEILLVESLGGGAWRAMLDTPRRLREGEALAAEGVRFRVGPRDAEGLRRLDAEGAVRLDKIGRVPLPPYIRRPEGERPFDGERYQTVYARRDGSIAAPTAGLHFTPAALDEIRARGAAVAFVTLHIGVGTFRPIRAVRIEDHRMTAERYEIPGETEAAVRGAKRVVAVGTSVVRTLETWARTGERAASADLFIHPPFEFRVVGALVTNFHLPRGTPLMLAAAFAGWERLKPAYEEAIREGYRFYSYGDAMLIE